MLHKLDSAKYARKSWQRRHRILGDNTCQKKSRGTVQPGSRVFLRTSFLGQTTRWGRNQWSSEDRVNFYNLNGWQIGTRGHGSKRWKTQKLMSSTKASSVRPKLLLRSGNLRGLTLWWVTADQWLRTTSTPNSKSLIYKKDKKTTSSLIMWHRYAKSTIRWLCPFFSRCKEVQGQLQRDRGRTFGTMCTCEDIARGTHSCKASKLVPVERLMDSGM